MSDLEALSKLLSCTAGEDIRGALHGAFQASKGPLNLSRNQGHVGHARSNILSLSCMTTFVIKNQTAKHGNCGRFSLMHGLQTARSHMLGSAMTAV